MLRDARKANGKRFVLHETARSEHRPREHDVLTDRIRPPADGTQVARPVGRERPLRDERGVVRRLHPLDAVDPEPVIPLLHPGDEGRHRVLRDERGCTGRDVLALRCGGDANHESCERLLLQMRVGIDRHHERRRHRGEGRVQRMVLALLRLEDTPVVESKALTRSVCQQGGLVGRIVVCDDDVHPTCVRELGDAFERANDRRALVPRRDDNGHGRPLTIGPVPLGGLEREFVVSRDQERKDHEPDHQTRDVGEEERDHPAHDRARSRSRAHLSTAPRPRC